METTVLERTLTERDHARLSNLSNLSRHAPHAAGADARGSAIDEVLGTCTLVASHEVAPDVVTMHSQVALRDLQTGRHQTLTLTYPANAEPSAGLVSVLSPIGSALLGLRVGDRALWRTPSGDEKSAEIVGLLFQPEASGDPAL